MKFIDIEARWASIAPNVLGKLSEQFESGDWIQGSKVYQFEEFLAKELRASGVKSCASGSDALWLALKLAGVSAGDEIILPPVTFAATLQAIIKVGATPIFADVNSETWTIDLESVQEVITNKHKSGNCR
jgi:UDP-2-acetamido-2-deoxy-ribo-hexuluronate aminotransferase